MEVLVVLKVLEVLEVMEDHRGLVVQVDLEGRDVDYFLIIFDGGIAHHGNEVLPKLKQQGSSWFCNLCDTQVYLLEKSANILTVRYVDIVSAKKDIKKELEHCLIRYPHSETYKVTRNKLLRFFRKIQSLNKTPQVTTADILVPLNDTKKEMNTTSVKRAEQATYVVGSYSLVLEIRSVAIGSASRVLEIRNHATDDLTDTVGSSSRVPKTQNVSINKKQKLKVKKRVIRDWKHKPVESMHW
ncbi:hypothetical protein Tco_1220020 [Tanacetum coccineum]